MSIGAGKSMGKAKAKITVRMSAAKKYLSCICGRRNGITTAKSAAAARTDFAVRRRRLLKHTRRMISIAVNAARMPSVEASGSSATLVKRAKTDEEL